MRWKDSEMSLFPIFLKLEGRRCLVVGAGSVAQQKIEGLIESGAKVQVVAPQATALVTEWAATGLIEWQARTFEVNDLDGVLLVIVATSSSEVNASVFRAAQETGVWCNVVDDPPHCDFYYPAVVRRGDLQIAVSTAGHSPALAQRLRRELEVQFGPEYGEWLARLGRARQHLFTSNIDPEERRRLLHRLASREAFETAVKTSSTGERV
jgi:precorrin-2 dehydrogenase/sirohydrochlorin ferrochelatase